MKLLFFTDAHGMSRKPSARLDDYSDTILKKIEWIGEYSRENHIEAVLCGGDLLDSPDVSETFIRKMCMILKTFPCPIFTVIGNHDEYGYSPDTFNRTTLGVAEGVGVLNRLYLEKGQALGDFNITGQDSDFNLDKGQQNIYKYSKSNRAEGKVNIHVVHGMLVEKTWPMVSCTTIDEVIEDNPNADIILSGHEHTGFGIIEKYRNNGSKVIFCNPGSLGRITSSTGDLRKDVRVAQIETSNGDFSVSLVSLPLTIAKPATEVINWEEIALEKANKKKSQAFIDKIQNTKISSFDIYSGLNDMKERENLSDEVVEECRKQLEKAEEERKNNEE